jgi:Uma2 family endonuclease
MVLPARQRCSFDGYLRSAGPPEFDPEDRKRHTVTNPTILGEVLNPSTEDYDRGEKLSHYQRIESLREVVLVAHDARRITVWRRRDDEWSHDEYEGDAFATLEAISCKLPIGEVFARAN